MSGREAALAESYRRYLGFSAETAERSAAETIRSLRDRDARISAAMKAARIVLDAAGSDLVVLGVGRDPLGTPLIRVRRSTENDPVWGMRVSTAAASRALESLRLVLADTDIEVLVSR